MLREYSAILCSVSIFRTVSYVLSRRRSRDSRTREISLLTRFSIEQMPDLSKT